MNEGTREKARAREEVVGLLHVAVDEHVLPGHEDLVHDEDGVVLVQPAGERIVEGAAQHGRPHLVGHAADELHAFRVGRHHEHDGEVLALDGNEPVMRHEGEVRERGAGGDHLGARHVEARVRLLHHPREHVGGATRRTWRNVAIHRGMDDGVVDEGHALLGVAIPALRVGLVGRVEVRVGAESAEEGRLVVGGAPEPAIGETRPGRDGIPPSHLLVHIGGRPEVAMREAAPLGGHGEDILQSRWSSCRAS